MRGIRSIPGREQAALAALAAILVLYAGELALGLHADVFEQVASNLVFVGAAAVCCLRAATVRGERVTWLLFGVGLLMWGLGDIYYSFAFWHVDDVPFPSLADVGYLAFYPPIYGALVLLFRSRERTLEASVWIDGLIGALAVGAVAAAVVFEAVQDGTGGSTATVATNLAYPLADLLIFSLVVGVVAAGGWNLNSAWGWIAGGLAIFAVTDSAYLYETARGTYQTGTLLDAGWPLTAVMLATAAWWPARPKSAVEGERGIYELPIALSLVALGVLIYEIFVRVQILAVVLASASIVATLARLWLTSRANAGIIEASRREAVTDALTGLANRRKLTEDLARKLSQITRERPLALILYDLEGFKEFNDRFGQLAGDAVLARLGGRLNSCVARHGALAYRMGGDEFCVLWPATKGVLLSVVADCARSLSESADGLSVGCSYGWVLLPSEAQNLESALRLADNRMHMHRQSDRTAAISLSR